MKVYLSHISALHFWRLWTGDTYLDEERSKKRVLSDCCKSAREDDGIVPSSTFFGYGKKHVLVQDPKLRVNPREYAYHLWSRKIPPRSLIELSDSIYVATPEFCFMQMAQVLSVPGLVALGMELCGTYRLRRGETAEKDHRPLTSPSKLTRFIENCQGVKGCKAARSAIRWILAGSASPMETWSFERLCFPARMKGYALPAPHPNGEMRLNEHQQVLAGRSTSYGDLYWPEQQVVVEYFGGDFHSGKAQMNSDAKRGNALESRGTKLYTLTSEIYHDLEKFDAFAREVARALGVRIHPRNNDLDIKSWQLMKELQEQEALTFTDAPDESAANTKFGDNRGK